MPPVDKVQDPEVMLQQLLDGQVNITELVTDIKEKIFKIEHALTLSLRNEHIKLCH